jgi:SAM-dependent methyltransferase
MSEYFEQREEPTPEDFARSSDERFGTMPDYIEEKQNTDPFVMKGNLAAMEGLLLHVTANLETFKALEEIHILDAGPAIGALSTLLCLQVLAQLGLLDKVQVHLVDISPEVLRKTKTGEFPLPAGIVREDLREKIMQKLAQAECHAGSAEKTPWNTSEFQIILACFLFHHLHDDTKPEVAKELMRLLAGNGCFCIAEEWFDNYEEDYAARHQGDQVTLAHEAIIRRETLRGLFQGAREIFQQDRSTTENYYAMCLTK